MADGAGPSLGLSVGATHLVAVTADHAVTRKVVRRLYRQHPPEVGVRSGNRRLDKPGLIIANFVDRMRDAVGIVAPNGSIHHNEVLIADGLRALANSVTGEDSPPGAVAVAYPAHWAPAAVDALGAALSWVSEWTNRPQGLSLIPDAAAALIAVRATAGIPARGIVAVCDFGGSGTSITLVDAAAEYRPLGPTVRHRDFSGDLIDQLVLTYVMSELPHTGSFDSVGISVIGSLTRLRIECRNAKEQLSSIGVATLIDQSPAMPTDVRLTRNELDGVIAGSLDGVVSAVEKAMGLNEIHRNDLVAIVSVGGVAAIPAVTTKLSAHFQVPVVATSRPQLTAALGASLRAARRPGDASATVLTSAVSRPVTRLATAVGGSAEQDSKADTPAFVHHVRRAAEPEIIPRYRQPVIIVIALVVAVLLVGMAVAIGLPSEDKPVAPSPSVSPGVTTRSTSPVFSVPEAPATESGQNAPPLPPNTSSPNTPEPEPPPPLEPEPESPPEPEPASSSDPPIAAFPRLHKVG